MTSTNSAITSHVDSRRASRVNAKHAPGPLRTPNRPNAHAALIGLAVMTAFLSLPAGLDNLLDAAPVDTHTALTPDSPDWRTGVDFAKQMRTEMSLTWQDAPLAEHLERLARTQRIFIWLDRRVDPSQKVTVQLRNGRVELVLEQLASKLGLAMGVVGPVVYFGPPESTRRLAAAAIDMRTAAAQLPSEVKRSLLRHTSSHWPLLTPPAEALKKLASDNNLAWNSLELVPHDLMPDRRLPSMSCSDQLCLLLAGFDLCYRYQDGLQIVSLPQAQMVQRSYVVSAARKRAFDEVIRRFPTATVKGTGGKLIVAGPNSLHAAMRDALRAAGKGGKNGGPQNAKTMYTLTIQAQPLGPVSKQLCAMLGLTLTIQQGIDTQQKISFAVKEASLEQLADALAASAQLDAEIKEGELILSAR